MERREPPLTDEGWYALHDFRTVDWDAWRAAPERRRERAVEEGASFLAATADPEEGASVAYAVLGHEADLLVVHLRPSTADLDALERRFERTALAGVTERSWSYLSVTEASGYSERAREYFEGDLDPDSGLARYIESRLYPTVPDAEHVCFYPMSKRRGPEDNWYDLPFEQRREHMDAHGDIGREYGGRVTQMITGSVGLDDWEWGVTLWADDLVDVKDLLYEMRFDPSTSRFAEFGPFYVGRRLRPADVGPWLAGERVPADADGAGSEAGGHSSTDAAGEHLHGDAGSGHPHGESARGGVDKARHSGHHGGDSDRGESDRQGDAADDVRGELADLGVYAGQPHGEDVHALVLYSEADPEELYDEVVGLRHNFEHYDTHVTTTVYSESDAGGDDESDAGGDDESDAGGDDESAGGGDERGNGAAGETAVVSLWETASAADTAAGFLSDLPGVVRRAGDTDDGFGTMGMFYTVKPDYREAFVERFAGVEGLLADTEGHRETALLANHEDENDMFVASRWDAKEDAMAFFRSEAFRDAVDWGREVLADRPRHVFLA